MSALRKAVIETLANKRAEQAAARRAIAASTAQAGVKRAEKSPLGGWYGPNVEWEFVANLTDGTTVVREKDGLDVLLGVKVTKDGAETQDPDEWEVAVWSQESGLAAVFGGWAKVEVLKSPWALGEYLERIESRPEPAPSREEAP